MLLAHYRYFLSSGAERYMFNIQRELEHRDHMVMPFSIRYAKNEPSPFEAFFVPPLGGEDEVYFDEHHRSLPTITRSLGRLVYSRTVERAVSTMVWETRPDVAYVLCYLRKLSPSLLVGLARRGVPIVVRISDYGMVCPEQHCLRDGHPCTECVGGRVSSNGRCTVPA